MINTAIGSNLQDMQGFPFVMNFLVLGILKAILLAVEAISFRKFSCSGKCRRPLVRQSSHFRDQQILFVSTSRSKWTATPHLPSFILSTRTTVPCFSSFAGSLD